MEKSENLIQSEILIEVNKRGHRLWRTNAGKVTTKDNRIVKLMPKGYPDLTGFRKSDGKFIVIEVKNAKGRLRPEQIKFKEFIARVYSLKSAISANIFIITSIVYVIT